MQVGSYLGNTGRAANLVATAAFDPGCVKTKSDLVVMPSEGRILRFFALSVTTSLKILGAVIPRRVFTQPGPKAELSDCFRRAGCSDLSAVPGTIYSADKLNFLCLGDI